MNYKRILGVSHGYFLLTGYQIRSYNTQSRHYSVTPLGALHFILLFMWYLICFEHHLEESAILKITLDLSPFLKNLVVLQIWLGLKAFIFSIIEWRSLTAVINGLADILLGEKDLPPLRCCAKRNEALAYVIMFGTLMVATGIGLYIAIEMKFELPPLDHIMIATAMFVPHLALAGSMRLHNLCLWLLRHKLLNLKSQLNLRKPHSKDIIIDVIKPTKPAESPSANVTDAEVNSNDRYHQTLSRLEIISSYLSSTNATLQRQMCILNALNFNCLLYGIFTRLYFNKTWHVLFFGSKLRVFYASNAAIFLCIYLDYALLLFVQFSFNGMIHAFIKDIENKINDLPSPAVENYSILQKIRLILKEKFKFKLFRIMDFNLWNFLNIQAVMHLIIAVIVIFQYFTDQLADLAEQIESNADD